MKHIELYISNSGKFSKSNINYLLTITFLALICFMSTGINNYINNTLSVDFSRGELIAIPVQPTDDFKFDDVPEETTEIITIKKNDNIRAILKKQNIPALQVTQIINILKSNGLETSLQIGQKITFDYELDLQEDLEHDLASETRQLIKVTIGASTKNTEFEIAKIDNNFISNKKQISKSTNKFFAKSSIKIDKNFMKSLKSLGLSTNSILEIINSYNCQIDFQRQIKPGDTITVISEKFLTNSGAFSHYGKVMYASLNLSGKEYNIYRYPAKNSSFFSEDGKSAKRNLLQNPLKLIRISSHYGNRIHPTLGYSKMHTGVDFSAPTGTPIYAAGEGIIIDLGYRGAYGKFIKIKHNRDLSTAYAHASHFNKSLKVGDKVKQGQIIAYVGDSGRTSGAHLHYEVEIKGKKVNPVSIKSLPSNELSGLELAEFKKFKNKIRLVNSKLGFNDEIMDNNLLSVK